MFDVVCFTRGARNVELFISHAERVMNQIIIYGCLRRLNS